jgi:hypothetical protein
LEGLGYDLASFLRNEPPPGVVLPFHDFDENVSELYFVLSVVLPFAKVLLVFVIVGFHIVFSFVISVFSFYLVVYHFLLVVEWCILVHELL